jgi:hypothetical protein
MPRDTRLVWLIEQTATSLEALGNKSIADLSNERCDEIVLVALAHFDELRDELKANGIDGAATRLNRLGHSIFDYAERITLANLRANGKSWKVKKLNRVGVKHSGHLPSKDVPIRDSLCREVITQAKETARFVRGLRHSIGLPKRFDEVTGNAVAPSSAVNGVAKKPVRPRKSKRGKAKGLTKPQEAVVTQIEDFDLTPQQIADKRKCCVQAVYQLYNRAKANPAYKRRRSFNLHDAKPMHANTELKGARANA